MWIDKLNHEHASISQNVFLTRLQLATDFFSLSNPQNVKNSKATYKKYPKHVHFLFEKTFVKHLA